jgi:hypothetical protein
VQQQELTTGRGAAAADSGYSVSVSGDTALVGAFQDTVGSNARQGSAYVFVRSGTTWTEQQKLTPGDGEEDEAFGSSASLSGDTALVGAPSRDVGSNIDQGAAYVFARSGTTWMQQQKLTAGDGAANDHFGNSVSVSGDTVLVGANAPPNLKEQVAAKQGFAYVFVRSGTTWMQQQKLTAGDGAVNDRFGNSVSVSGDTALVGANQHAVGANYLQGSAYVYLRAGTIWTQQEELTAGDGAANDYFGASVSVSGDTALVGAPRDDVGANGNQGSAYVFVRAGAAWTQQRQLTAGDGVANDAFGTSVSVSGDTALVGAPNVTVGSNVAQGAVYVLVRANTTWSQPQRVEAGDGAANDNFGQSVSMSGDTALVGAPLCPGPPPYGNPQEGAAYAYRLAGAGGAKCAAGTECLSGFCASGVCCDTACGGACDSCSIAEGASVDGKCAPVPRGYAGSPVCAPLACNGTSASCAACTADQDCTAGAYCASDGTCQPRRAQGSACNDCKVAGCRVCSGATAGCVDGFCCDTTCGNGCDVCAASLGATADGTCGTASVGVNTAGCGSPQACNGASISCPAGCASDADCATTHYCSPAFGCLPRKAQGAPCNAGAGADCKAAACRVCDASTAGCVDGVCCNSACTGSCSQCAPATGLCSPVSAGTPGSPSCGLLLCSGFALGCPTGCGSAADCAQSGPGAYCSVAHQCEARKSDGAACAVGDECVSSYCADGVCCDTACNGLCQACSAAKKGGGLSGQCDVIAAATDPDSECTAQPSSTCGQDGFCNGGGLCGTWAVGTVCGSPGCYSNVAKPQICIGANQCAPATSGTDCGAFLCSAGACLSACASDADCTAGNYCEPTTRACVSRKLIGSVCTATSECAANTFCADGVCCNSPCTGACQACAAALKESGADGQCGPVKAGAPDPACAATAAATCGTTGSCDAAGQCAKWASATACGATTCDSAGNTSTGHLCDGQGGCSQATTPVTCAPYRCGATACKTVCTANGDCVSGYYCNGGACVPQRADGATCAVAAECGSGSCVDGVCCKTACAGTCMACSAARKGTGVDGECGAVAAGTDPDSECSADSPTTCGQNGQCDGAGACAYYDATTGCGPSVCVGNESRPSVCTAKVTCGPSAAGTACGTFRCQASSGRCLLSCSADTDCVTGAYCDLATSACVLKKAIGATCQAKNECLGGSCADGFCCDAACAGRCEACSAAKKGQGNDGACGPIVAGSDPDDECATEAVTTCGTTGSCDGNRVCAKYGSGTDCSVTQGANFCTGNKAVGKVCDGVGVCSLNTAGIDCAPQKCVNGACAACVTAADCLDPNASYCDGGGVCQPRKAQGVSCTASAQCLSTFCVDGVCCAEVCDRGCEWCGDTNAPGVCEAVPKGPPKSGRPACGGTGTCGAQCDGANRDGCIYPGSATTCGTAKCQGDWVISAGTCDSSGGCAAGTLQDCGNYSCDSAAGACKTACTTKSDCRLGAVCDTSGSVGTCNATGAACQGAYNVKAADGTVSSCNGYRCVSGACQQQCGGNADCGTGYVCAGSSCVIGTADGGAGAGGAAGSGGGAGTGGASATGGGGTSASGGNAGAGGAAGRDGGSAGGAAAAGGGAGTGGTTAPDAGSGMPARDGGAKGGAAASGDNGACGCRVPKGGGGRGTPLSVAVLALGIVAMRRRRGKGAASRGSAP